jgi:hypothetical protein
MAEIYRLQNVPSTADYIIGLTALGPHVNDMYLRVSAYSIEDGKALLLENNCT